MADIIRIDKNKKDENRTKNIDGSKTKSMRQNNPHVFGVLDDQISNDREKVSTLVAGVRKVAEIATIYDLEDIASNPLCKEAGLAAVEEIENKGNVEIEKSGNVSALRVLDNIMGNIALPIIANKKGQIEDGVFMSEIDDTRRDIVRAAIEAANRMKKKLQEEKESAINSVANSDTKHLILNAIKEYEKEGNTDGLENIIKRNARAYLTSDGKITDVYLGDINYIQKEVVNAATRALRKIEN